MHIRRSRGQGVPAIRSRRKWLDVEIDWEEVADLVEESYRMTAPKRLIARLGAGGPRS